MQINTNNEYIFNDQITLLFNYCVKIKENFIFLYNYIKDFYVSKNKYNIISDEKYDIENNITISDSFEYKSKFYNMDESVFYDKDESVFHDKDESIFHDKDESVFHDKSQTVFHDKSQTVFYDKDESEFYDIDESVFYDIGNALTEIY